MAAASKLANVVFEPATFKSLSEVSSFFVDAFWLASTTFPGIVLDAADKRQLAAKVAEVLGPPRIGSCVYTSFLASVTVGMHHF